MTHQSFQSDKKNEGQTWLSSGRKNVQGIADPLKLLQISVYLVVVATAIDIIFFSMKYGIDNLFDFFYFQMKHDRFADLIKVSLSFKFITLPLLNKTAFASWPQLYQDYLIHNPYGGISSLWAGDLTHFHHPPFSQFLFTLCAYFISSTQNATIALWVWFGFYMLGVIWLSHGVQHPGNRSVRYKLVTVILCLVTYPAMLVFSRGNYNAGFTSILIILFLVHCFGQRKVSMGSLLFLAVAINIRPVALIFLFALPVVFGFKEAVAKLLFTLASSLFILTVFFLIEQTLYPDYVITNFLRGLEIYKVHYIIGSLGDSFNASLWSLVKNGTHMASLPLNHGDQWSIFLLVSFMAMILAILSIHAHKSKPAVVSFVLVCLYVLLAPICAEYHLLVFVAPLLILGQINSKNILTNQDRVVFIVSVFMLVPKNHVNYVGMPLTSIINPLILLVSLFLLQNMSLRSALVKTA
ncbi:MAG: hypothetical protein HQL65_01585 [Magnetococcales bacterium]|nr:hypothetical protein [Magnetococcales bacterium]